ncbi:MAG: alpha/beta hydrolase [Actinobacteria bacterium]|nr:MAG: alpha/beta hydrolase [Actinomycetota bacterium]
MAEVFAHDGTRLHVEVDGAGDPVTVLAHGLTNSCKELSAFTPMAPGTKVRFCFRGHGHSGTPEPGHYRFADFAGDVDVVARTYGATRAVGTSLGQGAITRLLAEQPDRFERLDLLETLPTDQAIDEILRGSGRASEYTDRPWLRDVDMLLWQDLQPLGVARALREVTLDVAIADRELLRRVSAPTLVIAREGDPVHPAELGRVLGELIPNAELILLGSEEELYASIPQLVERVARFLG